MFLFFFIFDDLPSNGNEWLRALTYKLFFLRLVFSLYHCSNHQKIETGMTLADYIIKFMRLEF